MKKKILEINSWLIVAIGTTTDIPNEKCYKIRTVEKVDAQTLDIISKELYS